MRRTGAKQGIFVVVLILLVFLPVCAQARNNVSEIDIDVSIRDDGSAYITQVWNGTFTEGTENYIPIDTDGIEISDFKVSDANGEYELLPSWDVSASFSEKRGKCGINITNDGIELCFGISRHGKNRYVIKYSVSNFITAYTDFDGTNFMFINPNMNTFPTKGKIRISLANGQQLDESNAGIWAFGYNGQIEFQDGKVVAYTQAPLEGENSMIVMLRLNKGLILPQKSVDYSFDEVKAQAMEGSDYNPDDVDIPDWLANLIGIIILLIIIAVAVLLLLALFFMIKRRIELRKFYNNAGYFRDIPNNGNMEVTYYLSKNFRIADNESLIIGATLLSMINRNCIAPVTTEKVGMFGKASTEVSLALLKEPDGETEKKLYHILQGAAGEDVVLQEKELATYAENNPKLLREFMDWAYAKGADDLGSSNGFVNSGGNHLRDLSETGKAQLAEAMGLKKYLLDFSLIAERKIEEVVIWQEYIVYATLFGIADKALAQFKKVYPSRLSDFESYNQNVIVAYSYYHTMYYSARNAEMAARSSGMGGASSLGGGGGFSSGGSGGGSR